MRQCNTCHANYERQRRKTNRVTAAGLSLQKSANAIARAPNLERLSSMLDVLTKQFGGPHQLYAFWLAEIERLKRTRRAGFRLLRFLEMLGNMEFLRDSAALERHSTLDSTVWQSALQDELRRPVNRCAASRSNHNWSFSAA